MFGLFNNGEENSPTENEIRDFMKQGAVFLDVRTPMEYEEGHIENAPNIPVQIIHEKLEEIKKMPQPIITYCRSGARSGQATIFLEKNGIKSINAGGFVQLDQILNS